MGVAIKNKMKTDTLLYVGCACSRENKRAFVKQLWNIHTLPSCSNCVVEYHLAMKWFLDIGF